MIQGLMIMMGQGSLYRLIRILRSSEVQRFKEEEQTEKDGFHGICGIYPKVLKVKNPKEKEDQEVVINQKKENSNLRA